MPTGVYPRTREGAMPPGQGATRPSPEVDHRKQVTCPYCEHRDTVSEYAFSVACRHCNRRIELRDLDIRSQLRENIHTGSLVRILPSGSVRGTVRANEVVVEGSVHGDVVAGERLRIAASGVVAVTSVHAVSKWRRERGSSGTQTSVIKPSLRHWRSVSEGAHDAADPPPLVRAYCAYAGPGAGYPKHPSPVLPSSPFFLSEREWRRGRDRQASGQASTTRLRRSCSITPALHHSTGRRAPGRPRLSNHAH